MKVHIIPVLQDNYTYVLEGSDKKAVIIDPGEAGPVIDFLETHNLTLSYVLNTHHHSDHIAGNEALQKKYGALLAGPAQEIARIPDMDILLKENDFLEFDGEKAVILETPGHTAGHICFHFPDSQIIFTGDTLFSLGCGRLFEGSAEQMWQSLQKIAALPNETLIYCGHEYTLANGVFCMAMEPDNKDLIKRMREAQNLSDENLPTLPTSIGQEKKTNTLFPADNAARFAELRELKNRF